MRLVHPAYDYVLNVPTFSICDAKGAISVTERTGYLEDAGSGESCQTFYEERKIRIPDTK